MRADQLKKLDDYQAKLAKLNGMKPEQFGFNDYSGLYSTLEGSISLFKFSRTVPSDSSICEIVVENPTPENVHIIYDQFEFDRKTTSFNRIQSAHWIHNDKKLEAILGRGYQKL